MPTASSSSCSGTAGACAWSVTCVPGRRGAPGAARRRRSSRTGRCPRSPGSSAARIWRCTRSTPTSCAGSTQRPGARSSSGCWAARRPRSCALRRSPRRSSRPARTRSGAPIAAASRARPSCRARLAGLREARREALAGAQAHEQAAAELARVRAELARARRDEAQLEGRRDLHDRHAPALRAWQELERLRAEAEQLVPKRSLRAPGRRPASVWRRCAASSTSAGASSPTCARSSRRRDSRPRSASASRC